MNLRDLKLGNKQILGFAVIVAVMAAANIYSIKKMETIKAEIDEVTSNWLPRALVISDIHAGTSALRIRQLQHVFATGDTAALNRTRAMSELVDLINDKLDTYERLKQASAAQDLYSQQEGQLYTAVDEKWEEYQDLSLAFFQLMLEGEKSRAVALLNGEAGLVFDEFTRKLNGLVNVNQKDAFDAATRAEATFNSTRAVVRTLLLVTIVLSILIVIVLVRLVTVPVRTLQQAAGNVAEGNLAVQVEIAGKDEIGNLAQSFNSMTTALREARDNTEQQAARLKQQNKALARTMVELRKSQEQLLMKEKMAALGQLVAGVAHEINNPVGTITASADVAGRCVQKFEDFLSKKGSSARRQANDESTKVLRIMRDNIRVILAAGERIATIVKSLKSFARLDEAEYQKTDVHDGIDSSLTLLGAELLTRVDIEKDYGELPEIFCYPGQLNQVFLNLLTNASDAIEHEGDIKIRTFQEGDNIHIEIADTGRGIPEEKLSSLFDFGFNQGGPRVKMSSGLSTSYTIIQKHDGDIAVHSEVGKGTTFTIVLPVK